MSSIAKSMHPFGQKDLYCLFLITTSLQINIFSLSKIRKNNNNQKDHLTFHYSEVITILVIKCQGSNKVVVGKTIEVF